MTADRLDGRAPVAARGTYDARVRRADFAGDVYLTRPDATLDADSVVYFRRTERARAYGRAVLQRIGEGDDGAAPADSSRRTFLFGETLLFDGQAETASARGEAAGPDGPGRDPLLLVLRADSTGRVDSTLARAPRIDAARTVAGADTVTVLTAAGGVRVWERRLRAVADSVVFRRLAAGAAGPDSAGVSAGAVPTAASGAGAPPGTGPPGAGPPRPVPPASGSAPPASGPPAPGSTASGPGPGLPERDRIFLYGSRPSVWADGAQITGDSLAVFASGGAADSLTVRGTAFAARVDSTLGRLQQIAGAQMLGRFDGDELRRLDVWPNAQALYYRATPDGLLDGAFQFAARQPVVRVPERRPHPDRRRPRDRGGRLRPVQRAPGRPPARVRVRLRRRADPGRAGRRRVGGRVARPVRAAGRGPRPGRGAASGRARPPRRGPRPARARPAGDGRLAWTAR